MYGAYMYMKIRCGADGAVRCGAKNNIHDNDTVRCGAQGRGAAADDQRIHMQPSGLLVHCGRMWVYTAAVCGTLEKRIEQSEHQQV